MIKKLRDIPIAELFEGPDNSLCCLVVDLDPQLLDIFSQGIFIFLGLVKATQECVPVLSRKAFPPMLSTRTKQMLSKSKLVYMSYKVEEDRR